LAPPPSVLTEDARKRLRAIEEFSNLGSGFNIAMRDLDIRGAGNILGGEQSGFISDIGFEMYQKILNEALQELKETEFKDLYAKEKPVDYITDCQLDTDLDALIPDAYVENVAERLSLYKELSKIADEEKLQFFTLALEDRFGALPQAVVNLTNSMRVKWLGKELGFEKIRMKGGYLYAYFIENQESDFFSGEYFGSLLQYIQMQPICKIREKDARLSIIFREVKSVEKAFHILSEMKRALLTDVK
jgi:transcription-repair coupling factor (superfamily II helicase)